MSASSASSTLLEAIASSLTELFAPKIHEERIPGMLQGYAFVTDEMMAYFRSRLGQAPRDAGFALDLRAPSTPTRPRSARPSATALLFKMQRALGAARRAAPRLRAGRRGPARRLRAGGSRGREGRRVSHAPARRDPSGRPAPLGSSALRQGARPLGAAGARARAVSLRHLGRRSSSRLRRGGDAGRARRRPRGRVRGAARGDRGRRRHDAGRPRRPGLPAQPAPETSDV